MLTVCRYSPGYGSSRVERRRSTEAALQSDTTLAKTELCSGGGAQKEHLDEGFWELTTQE